MNSDGPNKSLPLIKVVIYLNEDEWHGYQSESLWAERISDDRCRLRNTPFYAKGISVEDIVIVERDGDKNLFKSVSIASGHSTYRILFNNKISTEVFKNYWNPLEKLGCTFESSEGDQMLLAVDVPPKADIYEVYRLLEKGENDEIWGFEEGHCGHVLK